MSELRGSSGQGGDDPRESGDQPEHQPVEQTEPAREETRTQQEYYEALNEPDPEDDDDPDWANNRHSTDQADTQEVTPESEDDDSADMPREPDQEVSVDRPYDEGAPAAEAETDERTDEGASVGDQPDPRERDGDVTFESEVVDEPLERRDASTDVAGAEAAGTSDHAEEVNDVGASSQARELPDQTMARDEHRQDPQERLADHRERQDGDAVVSRDDQHHASAPDLGGNGAGPRAEIQERLPGDQADQATTENKAATQGQASMESRDEIPFDEAPGLRESRASDEVPRSDAYREIPHADIADRHVEEQAEADMSVDLAAERASESAEKPPAEQLADNREDGLPHRSVEGTGAQQADPWSNPQKSELSGGTADQRDAGPAEIAAPDGTFTESPSRSRERGELRQETGDRGLNEDESSDTDPAGRETPHETPEPPTEQHQKDADRGDDLPDSPPTGEDLLKGDDEKKSRPERFREQFYENADDTLDAISETVESIDDIFGPPPPTEAREAVPARGQEGVPQYGDTPGGPTEGVVVFIALTAEAGRAGWKRWRVRRAG